jgi:uroporphyrinogen decarboxylase
MKKFDPAFIEGFRGYTKDRRPDFDNLLLVLKRRRPRRHTLFEFFLNPQLEMLIAGAQDMPEDPLARDAMRIRAFRMAGYDYCTIPASPMGFPSNKSNHGKSSLNINENPIITDRKSYERYPWPDPAACDDGHVARCGALLPDGMKIISQSPGGVLENVMSLIGYEKLCYLLDDDPAFLRELFDQVGKRLLRYYELASAYGCIGAFVANDDWGFATQTLLSPADMRRYVFPWYRKIVDMLHESGRPVLLHSCGQLRGVYEDIVALGLDAKHSFEDKIWPVEDAYRGLHHRIAVLGGIDVDFICRRSCEEIYNRACAMLELGADGGYALGSGNSIPRYVPAEGYLAMACAALVNG